MYDQEIKNKVREKILPTAITRLTDTSRSANIVQISELEVTLDWLVSQTRPFIGDTAFEAVCKREFEDWQAFHKSVYPRKKASEVKVLYLCGSEPLNDLKVMERCGICCHNVWAVTSKEDYKNAIAELLKNNVPLKIHQGSLGEFLEKFNESFDLIYFDACSPFCCGKPNTIHPLVNLFQKDRLNSPGVLITNFCEPPATVGQAKNRLIDYVATYFAPRYNDLPSSVHKNGPEPAESAMDVRIFREFTVSHLDELYSDFITRLIIDLGMNVIPWWRAFSMGAFARSFLQQIEREKEIRKSETTQSEFEINRSGYPLVSFLKNLQQLQNNHGPLSFFMDERDDQSRSMDEIVQIASMVDSVIEGHWDILSEPMIVAAASCWFDRDIRVTCDIPLPNLSINSLIGTYGKPFFINPRVSERISYCAKSTRMYCDLFVYDQCRSYFDWFPTCELLPKRMQSLPFQIVARCIMDRICRHNFSTDTHPFYGASVTSLGETPVSNWYNLEDRMWLN